MNALISSFAHYHESGVLALTIDGAQIAQWFSRDDAYRLLSNQAVSRNKSVLLTSVDASGTVLFQEVFTLTGSILPYFEPAHVHPNVPAAPIQELPVFVPEPVFVEPVYVEPVRAFVAPEPVYVQPVVVPTAPAPVYVAPAPVYVEPEVIYVPVLEPVRPHLQPADFIALDSKRADGLSAIFEEQQETPEQRSLFG